MNQLALTFIRPADVNVYASGDLVANNTAAGAVVPLAFNGSGRMAIRRGRLLKSGVSVANASFRIHLFDDSPVPANGDNGVWLVDGVAKNYLGSIDITVDKVFSDGAGGTGAPLAGLEINIMDSSDYVIYGLLEARGAYTPASAEVFTVILEIQQFE